MSSPLEIPIGPFLEPSEVKTKHTSQSPLKQEGESLSPAYQVSTPAGTPRQTYWACEHLCVTKLGKRCTWQGREALPQLWWHTARDLSALEHQDSRVSEAQKLLRGQTLLPERKRKCHQAWPHQGHSAGDHKPSRTPTFPSHSPPFLSGSCLKLYCSIQ